jgi:hypothetical protein
MQASSGTGIPNLFTAEDAVRAKIVADLRLHGVGFELLKEAAERLSSHPAPLGAGTVVLVNGSVTVVDAEYAALAITQESESITVTYNTEHAVREIQSALSAA